MRIPLPLAALTATLAGCSAEPATPAQSVARPASILASSNPAPDSVSVEPVYSLQLRFSPPARLEELLIDGPGGTIASMVTSVGERETYVVPIDAPGPGVYTVRWRASSGGAEHRGQFGFTVRD